jgi:hypothetical protein
VTDVALKRIRPVVRWSVASVIVLWLGFIAEKPIVNASLPTLRAVFAFVQSSFVILDMQIARDGANETLQVRADLAKSKYVSGRFVYPINASGTSSQQLKGWLQVNLTLGGLLQYELLMLIVVAAWPTRDARQYLVRFAIAAPFVVALFLINAVCTLFAEFTNGVYHTYAPDDFLLSLAWSKFLMGGGGVLLSLLSAAACISLAQRNQVR